MKKLYNFWRLPAPERHLILLSVFLLGAIKLGLKLLPFRVLWKVLNQLSLPGFTLNQSHSIPKIVWSIERVTPYLRVKCLARALATQVLLRHQGYSTQLRIGVAKDQQGVLKAHAWLESQGTIMIGRVPDLSEYTPLPNLHIQNV